MTMSEIASDAVPARQRETSMFPLRVLVPIRFPARVTYGLIALNVIVFLLQGSLSEASQHAYTFTYGLVPARYMHPQWALRTGLSPVNYLPFLTNAFMHGNWLHLAVNMWTLWLFGPAVEDRLGSIRYLVFYLTCAAVASAAHTWMNVDSTVPALGASGPVAGVLGASIGLFPFSNVWILVPVIFIPLFFAVPAFVFIALWFILQLVQGLGSTLIPQEAAIAWWAHIGGFLAGMVMAPLLCLSLKAYRHRFAD